MKYIHNIGHNEYFDLDIKFLYSVIFFEGDIINSIGFKYVFHNFSAWVSFYSSHKEHFTVFLRNLVLIWVNI